MFLLILIIYCVFLLSWRLSKSEEEKIELKATLNSVQKEGLQINQTLKVKGQNDSSWYKS